MVELTSKYTKINTATIIIVLTSILYIFSNVSCSYHPGKLSDDEIFKNYYSNHFNLNNHKIWTADSTFYSNDLVSAENAYKSMISDATYSNPEREYALNQLLFIYDELRDQIKFESLYAKYKNQYLSEDLILNTQNHILSNLSCPAIDFNPQKYLKLLKPEFDENHHLVTKLYLEYYKQNAYTSYNHENLIEADNKLEKLIPKYDNRTKDLYHYYLLKFHYHFSIVDNEHAHYYSNSLKDNNNFNFELSSIQIAEALLLLGKYMLFVLPNNYEGFQFIDASVKLVQLNEELTYKPISLYILSQASILNERLLYKKELYKKLLHSEDQFSPLVKLYISKLNYYELLETNKHDSIIYLSKRLIDELNNTKYLFHKEHIIPKWFMAISERKKKNYLKSNQVIFNSLMDKHSFDTLAYSVDNVKESKMLEVEYYSFAYANEFLSNHLQQYLETNSIKELEIAYSYLPIIDKLINKDFTSIYENDIIEMSINKQDVYNTILNILFEKYKLGHNIMEEFIHYSDKNKSELLQIQKQTYSNREISKVSRIDKQLIRNFVGKGNYKERYELIKEKTKLNAKIKHDISFDFPNLAKKIEKLTEEDQKIIIYNIVDTSVYIQEITKNEYNLHRTTIAKEHILLYNKYVFTNSEKLFIDKRNQKTIYKALIEPWDNDTTSVVTIISDNILLNFPFEAIIIENNVKPKFLIDKYQVYYSHSLKTSSKYPKIDFNHTSISCFSFNSKEDFYNLKLSHTNLPGAFNEVKYIKKNYPHSKTYFGAESNKHNFYKSYYEDELLHVAVHGQSDEIKKYANYLLLKSDSNKIDTLYGYDLLGNYAEPKLVILSSCETSKGAVAAGEGLYSLVRFFLLNGTKNVISSKWVMDDSAGELFFNEFYMINTENNNILNRLSNARNKLKNKDGFKHPYYWSGIQLFSN